MARAALLALISLCVLPAVTGAGTLSCGPANCFASGLSTGAVLQRSPARAALYGSSPSRPGTPLTLVFKNVPTGGSESYPTTVAADGTWKVLLPPHPAGGNYSAALSGAGGNTTIHDLTFGDVILCTGQSNAWLPLWFTFNRNISTAAVAAGRYTNIRVWRGGLNEVPYTQDGNWVGPAGKRPGSDASDALTNQWRKPAELLSPNDIRANEPWFWEVPALCYYYAEALTDLLSTVGTPPPLGVVTTPEGGTQLEAWTSFETQAKCANVTCECQTKGCSPYQPISPPVCVKNADLWRGNMQPLVNMTISHMLWYQGENNLEFDAGSSVTGAGYGCLWKHAVADWRAAWSAVPGTTDPNFPIGFVELADGTDESFGVSMAGFRIAQTANWGYAPNPDLPNTFMAHAHDAGDPWDADQCADPNSCCVDKYVPLGPTCIGDHRGEWSYNATNWFMGCVHRAWRWMGGRSFHSVCIGSPPLTPPPTLQPVRSTSLRLASPKPDLPPCTTAPSPARAPSSPAAPSPAPR